MPFIRLFLVKFRRRARSSWAWRDTSLGLTDRGVDYRRAFSYLSLGMTVPLFALFGFIIGREYGEPALGIVLGTLLGIGLFLADVLTRAAREARGWKAESDRTSE